MQISVFGLGYVGTVTAACLAKDGHDIIGVDSNPTKVDFIERGASPVIEDDVDDMLTAALSERRLTATTSAQEAVEASDISIVCVGTPSLRNGCLDTSRIEEVSIQIGQAIKQKGTFHTVVIRSTILPGTTNQMIVPALEHATGGKLGETFGLAYNPEFMRESTAVYDFYNPPKTVIGADDQKTAARVASLYEHLDAPLLLTSIEPAEMVKYVDNSWHALKVAFGNEIGNICKAVGVDSHEVMDIFCQDTKLNISPYYLKPGFAFGGACLPKDVRALAYKARQLDLDLPVLTSIMPSNRQQVERSFDWIAERGQKKIAFLGFSFKAGTDDLRESPQVELIERLIGKGFDLRLYDKHVNLARLMGANRDYILNVIPHIAQIMVKDVDEALDHGEIVVVGNNDEDFANLGARLREDQVLLDLVRLKGTSALADRYDGSIGELSRPRRILIIVENLPVPFDRRVWSEATTLRQAGYEVAVICPKGKDAEAPFEELDGVQIYRHPLPLEARGQWAYPLEYLSALVFEFWLSLKVLWRQGFDVIHACNPPDTIFLIGGFYKLFGKRFVFDHHDINPELYLAKFGREDRFYRLLCALERWTFRLADISIATNESYKAIATGRGGMNEGDVYVVRSGPKLDRLKILPPSPALKMGRDYLIGYVGVIGQQEGIDLLLQAARHIVFDKKRDDVHFGIVGGGPELAAMQSLAFEMGLADYVTFTGRAPDDELLAMLNTADVCVNPDRVNEMNDKSTMNKIMEYMALEKPIVQFDLTEGRVSAAEASLYAKANDPVDMADKILELLADPERRARMGAFGRKRVSEELAWSHEAPKLLAAYQHLFEVKP